MSKKTAYFELSAKNGLLKIELPIKVSADFKFYYIPKDLPKIILDSPHAPYGKREYFDSYRELRASVQEIIDNYEASIMDEHREKVILYEIDTDCSKGHQLKVIYVVLNKVTLSNGKNKTHEYYRERSYDSGSRKSRTQEYVSKSDFFDHYGKPLEMPWTKEREAFFKDLCGKVDSLAEQVDLAIGKRPETLARKIDQGALALMGGFNE